MSKATRKQIRLWMLGVISKQGIPMSKQEVEDQVSLSISAFQVRFQAEAFCAASMDAVAASERYWNEAAISQALNAWVSTNQPVVVASLPPEVEAAPLDDAGKRLVAMFYNASSDAEAARALDFIRGRFDEGPWRWLVKTEPRVDHIAYERGWHSPATPGERAYDWDDEAAIRERVRRLFALDREGRLAGATWKIAFDLLVRAVKSHAPQHGPAMFDEMYRVTTPQAPVPVPPVDEMAGNLFGD